jgi:uncharacterized protein with von Willebrand factor type A (vWA) domain
MGKTGLYTHILLDASGSMGPYVIQTMKSFNKYVLDLKGVPNARLALSTFRSAGWNDDNTVVEDIRLPTPLNDFGALTDSDYTVGGGTPLYDSIALTVTKIRATAKPGEQIVMVIITDGAENSSHNFKQEDIKNMLRRCQNEGWTVLFLGANVNAVQIAAGMGLPPTAALDYSMNKIEETFQIAGAATKRAADGNFGGFLPSEKKDAK